MSLFQTLFNADLAPMDKLSMILPYIGSVLIVIFFILPIHECAHGWIAYKLGDDTAKNSGRLTFNPLPSIDPMGALFLLFFGFGWAKPVMVDERNFKNPRAGMALTALAGPMSNLICGFLGAIIYYAVWAATGGGAPVWVKQLIISYVAINVGIAVFNMLPIPPLDGSKIMGAFLSDKARMWYYRYQTVFMMLIMVLMFSGLLNRPLYYLIDGCLYGVQWLASRPFVWAGVL